MSELIKQREYEAIDFITSTSVSWTQYKEWAVEEYGVHARTAQRYWKGAWKRINEIYSEDEIRQQTQQAVMKIDKLYAEAMQEKGDYNSRINMLKERARLLGLGKTNVNVTGDVKLSFDFDNAEADMIDEN